MCCLLCLVSSGDVRETLLKIKREGYFLSDAVIEAAYQASQRR